MATSSDLTAMLAAIDAGDDSALPILADALEESLGVSSSFLQRRCPRRVGDGWEWGYHSRYQPTVCLDGFHVPYPVWQRLAKQPYSSRSAAYIALAESLL